MKTDDVVPSGEGPLSGPISLRFPQRLLERIEKIAAATQNSRTDTVMYLCRWAAAQYEANAAPSKKKGTG